MPLVVQDLMEEFREMVNDCIRNGLENNVITNIKLAKLCYHSLKKYDIPSYYKVSAINKAAGILDNRRKSIKRNIMTKDPYMRKPIVTTYFGFKIENGALRIPVGRKAYHIIKLNNHTLQVLSDPSLRVRSFVLTKNILSIAYSKEVQDIACMNTAGIDRNFANMTVGNSQNVIQYNLSQATKIAQTTRDVMRSFKRNDVRIRRKLHSKYGRRRKNRIAQMLHRVSKTVVRSAKEERIALVFEDIRHIRRLCRKGNGQSRRHHANMNDGWSFAEIRRQLEYKARWEGLAVIQLSCVETRGTL